MRHLTITTPATDRTLLTLAEMREAAGVTDSSQDDLLTLLEARCADLIASECNVAIGAGANPTLKREALTEVIRFEPWRPTLMLSRRHNVTITSVVEDTLTIDAADYLVDPESAVLSRLSDSYPTGWYGQVNTIVYAAGFDTVPGDLKAAAMGFLRSTFQSATRDALVKAETKDIPGVMSISRQYWVGSVPGQSTEGVVAAPIAGLLKRFRNTGIA